MKKFLITMTYRVGRGATAEVAREITSKIELSAEDITTAMATAMNDSHVNGELRAICVFEIGG